MTPARMIVDLAAIGENYLCLRDLTNCLAGAAVKADAYGLGLEPVALHLYKLGCNDFFTANLKEALILRDVIADCRIHQLGGLAQTDIPTLLEARITPVLNSPEQVQIWRTVPASCDVMIDTGMNRLGIACEDLPDISWSDLDIDLAMSHYACADDPDSPMTRTQQLLFDNVYKKTKAKRASIANSAGCCHDGPYYDLTRPGISLYGGIVHPKLQDRIQPALTVEAMVLQVRTVRQGHSVGYNAAWTASDDCRVAILGLGYAHGYGRCFSNKGQVLIKEHPCPVLGLTSMDLVAVLLHPDMSCTTDDKALILGQDGVVSLPSLAATSGLTQYEILCAMGNRLERTYLN